VPALCDGGTPRLLSWDPTCTEEEACVVLDAEGTLEPWLEGFTARLSDARDPLTSMSGGFTTVMNP
jgi:hypothetical protein